MGLFANMETMNSEENDQRLKTRLYFLGDPTKLENVDVSRHMCKECGQVFHKKLGLKFHMLDVHNKLLDDVKREGYGENKQGNEMATIIQLTKLGMPKNLGMMILALVTLVLLEKMEFENSNEIYCIINMMELTLHLKIIYNCPTPK